MAGQTDELKKLVGVATDFGLSADIRTRAVDHVGKIGTHEALLALLELAANQQLTRGERERTLKHAREIVRSER